MNLYFILILSVLCFIIWKLNFLSKNILSKKVIIGLFLFRIVFGLINGYLDIYFFTLSDSRAYQLNGLEEYHTLLSNPLEYFTSFFRDTHHNHYSGFFSISNSYWNDLKNNVVNKIVSILDVISLGNFYINILLFNFLIFIASLYFFKLLSTKYPAKILSLIFLIFLLPSFMFYSSALHKEGLLFISLIAIIYNFDKSIESKCISLNGLLIILTSLFFILIIRNYSFLLLLPALLGWYISNNYKWSVKTVFYTIYIILILIFCSAGYIMQSKMSPSKMAMDRQLQFIKLGTRANSVLFIPELKPTVLSYLQCLPFALNHSFLRPYPNEFGTLYLPFSIEILVTILIIVLYFSFREKNKEQPLLHFLKYFSISLIVIIGFTVPIIGALLRYKSVYLQLLLIALVCNIDWERVISLFSLKKNHIS